MSDQSFVGMVTRLAVEIESDPRKYAFVEQNCNSQRSCEDIFAFIWNLEEVQRILTPKLMPSTKSERKASLLREEGNAYYKKRDFDKALQLYNQSIMEAPHPQISDANLCENTGREDAYLSPLINLSKYGGSPEGESVALATGFANRSAIMFEMKLYEKCIIDIDLAMKYGYPHDKQKKLEARREKCLIELNKSTSPKKLLPKAKHVSSETPGTSSATEPDQEFCQKILCSLGIDSENEKIHHIRSYEIREPPKMSRVNKKVPTLSRAVEYSFIPTKGRGLLATKNIKPGEVLGVEEAHSVYIDSQKLHLYCSTCLRLTFNPLPCPACPEVLYCNETCRMRGLTEEHWLECSLLSTLIYLGLTENNILSKMLKSLTYSQLDDFISRLRKEEEEHGGPVNPEKVFLISQSYKSVYHLCTNKEKQSFPFIMMQCQVALVFTKLLLQSGRFFINDKGEPVDPTTEDIVKTGAALLYHSMQLHCNPFQIIDLQLKETVGAGVFPALSLINHSCYPSAKHYSTGRTLALRALRPIAAGEEITVSYVAEFHKQKREERNKILSHYKFSCTCEACVNNWPTLLDDMPTLVFKCLSCKVPTGAKLLLCPACDANTQNPRAQFLTLPKELQEEVDKTWTGIMESCVINEKLNNGKRLNLADYNFICKTIEQVFRHMAMPCQHIVIMQNFLFRCFADGH